MRCPHCREVILREVVYCPFCGVQVEQYDSRLPQHPRDRYRLKRPHRGGLILGMGLLSFLLALPCGPLDLLLALPTWIMGQGDLGRMRAHSMDNGGRGLTTVGTTCAIIATIVAILRSLPLILGR
jgi:hypothetical protein